MAIAVNGTHVPRRYLRKFYVRTAFHRDTLTRHEGERVRKYRLKSPTMAVERGGTDGRMQLATVPAGALLTIVGEAQQSGLIDVLFEGRIVAMFLRDIEDRGGRILGPSSLTLGRPFNGRSTR